jgi:hypothetical protein
MFHLLVANPAFPRHQTIENLIHVIRSQPNLAKEASSDLIGIGEAIHDTASPQEISALLRGTLFQESYVRNSCLQALQVFLLYSPFTIAPSHISLSHLISRIWIGRPNYGLPVTMMTNKTPG